MTRQIDYTSRECSWIWTLAIVGLVGINGIFLYGVPVRPGEEIR